MTNYFIMFMLFIYFIYLLISFIYLFIEIANSNTLNTVSIASKRISNESEHSDKELLTSY